MNEGDTEFYHYIAQEINKAEENKTYTVSVYFKNVDSPFGSFYLHDEASVGNAVWSNINLSTKAFDGSINCADTFSACSHTLTEIESGLYRVTMTATVPDTVTTLAIRWHMTQTAGDLWVTGTNKVVGLSGFQLSESATPLVYVATTTEAVTMPESQVPSTQDIGVKSMRLDTVTSLGTCDASEKGRKRLTEVSFVTTEWTYKRTGEGTYAWVEVTPNGSGAVSTVFGKSGDVTAQTGDYSFSQVSGTVTDSQVATGIAATKIGSGAVSNEEFGHLDGVTSAVQTQLNGKQATVTGAATSIVSDDLTANRALLSGATGKVAVSSVSSTELGHLSGVTSGVQSQINNKADSSALTSHTGDTNNPHSVTKSQISLGSVENYGIASQAEAQAGTANEKYMTPLRTAEAIAALASGGGDVVSVFGRTGTVVFENGNATATQITNTPTGDIAATTVQATLNELDTEKAAASSLSSHTGNTSNPHSVTKSQVSLGSVENYAVASQDEAQTGTANDKYMTPLRTAEAIAALTPADQVTSVFGRTGVVVFENGDATATQITNTPAGDIAATTVQAALNELDTEKAASSALTSHTGNTSNPHSVTKSQVSLGSVENYAVASQAEAEAGTANDKYMTPLRAAQAIAALASGDIGTCSVTDGVMTCPGGFDAGDGTEAGAIILSELAANGDNSFYLYGADSQAADGCIVVNGTPADGQVLRGTSSTVTKGSLTCRVMEWASSGGTPKNRQITLVINNPTSTGVKACSVSEVGHTIVAAHLISDALPTGANLVVDVRKVAFGSYTGPGSASTITASASPTISTGDTNPRYADTTLTGWTTSITADDVICVAVSTAPTGGVTWASLTLEVQ